MRLAAEISTVYRCLGCGKVFRQWPEDACCDEGHDTTGAGRLLHPNEIADLAQVSRSTVNQWINTGALPALRQGQVVRVRPQDWDLFVAGKC